MSLSLPAANLSPRQFRELLERLGPIFVKIGQYLALRPDLVAQEYCDELLLLLDRVEPFPADRARAILARELGRDPFEVFAVLSATPTAAGSLAQVHTGRLRSGEQVVVKILRPDIEERIERDLSRARLLSRLLEIVGAVPLVSPAEVVDELGGWLRQEIDLRRELANLERLWQLTAGDVCQRVPRPFPGYSTQRILVTEWLPGVAVSEILAALRSDPEAAERRLRELGVDRDRLARNLLVSSLRQIFEYRFFHADLHPGNVLALPGDVVGFVDFGLCSELAGAVREKQMRYLMAVYSGETERIFQAVSELLVEGEETDPESFRQDFFAAARELELGEQGSRAKRERSPLGRYLIGVMTAARQNDLTVPTRLLALYRTLLTVETVADELGVDQGLRTVGDRFFRRLQQRELLELVDDGEIQAILLNLLNLVREAPGQLHQILSEVADGSYSLRAYLSEAPRSKRSRDRRARLWAVSVLTVGVALLLTVPDLPAPWGVSLAWPLGAFLAILYGVVFFLWRRLD